MVSEKPFWCGFRALSYAAEGIGSPETRRKFVTSALRALKNNRPMKGEWDCERWNIRPNHVSLLNLITMPAKYHNQRVLVVGVGNLEFESDSLYFSKEDYKYNINKNAIWLNLEPILTARSYEELVKSNGKYIIVEGRFNGFCQGHKNLWSGCIKNVTRYDNLEERGDPGHPQFDINSQPTRELQLRQAQPPM